MSRWGPGITYLGLLAALQEADALLLLDPGLQVHLLQDPPHLMVQVRLYLEAGEHTITFPTPGDSIDLSGPSQLLYLALDLRFP